MRQSRQHRHRGVRVTLTERDCLLLETLSRFRIARTKDLLAVVFAEIHPMTASVRLRRLFDAGYLDVQCGDRSQENIYSLGPLGLRWAHQHGLRGRHVPRGSSAHHLAVVRVWSGVSEVLKVIPGAGMDLARPDWELREEFGEAGLPIIPDLFLVLRAESPGGEQTAALAVEVDLGTEPLAVIERKIAIYDELAADDHGLFGYREFGLAVALANPGRAVAVRQILEHGWSGWWLLWSEAEGPAEAIASVMGVLSEAGDAPVTDSRNGNGGRGAVSAADSGPNRRQRVGP